MYRHVTSSNSTRKPGIIERSRDIEWYREIIGSTGLQPAFLGRGRESTGFGCGFFGRTRCAFFGAGRAGRAEAVRGHGRQGIRVLFRLGISYFTWVGRVMLMSWCSTHLKYLKILSHCGNSWNTTSNNSSKSDSRHSAPGEALQRSCRISARIFSTCFGILFKHLQTSYNIFKLWKPASGAGSLAVRAGGCTSLACRGGEKL